MDNKTYMYLSIGEFSKITGANIKSLRYYEKINVLKPVYVNPETKYRYYSLSQVQIVDIIQLCIELGIPLKNFSDYVDEEQNVHYEALLDYGKELAEKKIKTITRGLCMINDAKLEIQESEKYKNRKSFYFRDLPEKYYYIQALPVIDSEKEYYTMHNDAFMELTELGIETNYNYGVLHEYKQDSHNVYMYVEVPEYMEDIENLVRFPAGKYKCKQQAEENWDHPEVAFKNIESIKKTTYIFIAELMFKKGNLGFSKLEYRMPCDGEVELGEFNSI